MIFVGVSKCASECADRPPPLGCLDAGVASWRVVEEKEGYNAGGCMRGGGPRERAAAVTSRAHYVPASSPWCVRPLCPS